MDLLFAAASKMSAPKLIKKPTIITKSVAKNAPLIRNFAESSEIESNNQKRFVQTNGETGDYDLCY